MIVAKDPFAFATGWRKLVALTGLTALFFVAHLLLLHLPRINLEYAFSEGAKYFADGDPGHLQQYFDHEANTLAVPWLAFAIHKLLPGLDFVDTPRLVSALGIPLLVYGLLRINRQLAEKANPYLLVSIVLLNPLVWTFAGRGTADFLPGALGTFGLSLYWGGEETKHANLWRIAAASAVLGIAAVVKYHAFLLLGGVAVAIAIRRSGNYGMMLIEWTAAAAPASILLIAYLLAVRTNFGFWVTPPRFQQALGLDTAAGPGNLVRYAGYFILVTAPLSLTIPWQRAMELRSRYGAAMLMLGAAFVLGYFILSDTGEMNLGPLDPYVDKGVANGVLASLSVLLPIRLAMGFGRSSSAIRDADLKLGLAATIIVFILALSPTRPAQRYLLCIIPLFYFFLLAPQKHHRATLAATLLFSVILDVYILLNQVATGIASEKMAQRIAELGLLSSTDPGTIEGNVGDQFFPYRNEQKVFTVVVGNVDGRVAETQYNLVPGLPFLGKSYSLVQLPSK